MKLKDEKKLEAIISAACHLAGERGLFGLTLSQIAKQAGLGTSTLYVYFADKEALYNEVFRRAKREALDFYSADIDPDKPVKAQVRGVWNRMLDHRLQRFDQVSFIEQFETSSFMTDESRVLSTRLNDRLMRIITEGQEAEILKTVPVPYLTSHFVGSIRETARLIRAGQIKDTKENRAIAFQVCWGGIRS